MNSLDLDFRFKFKIFLHLNWYFDLLSSKTIFWYLDEKCFLVCAFVKREEEMLCDGTNFEKNKKLVDKWDSIDLLGMHLSGWVETIVCREENKMKKK